MSDTEVEHESLKNQSSGWGGAREGAGRKPGSENEDTKLRREALEQFRNRVAQGVNKLFNSQFDLATGEKYLMVVRTIGSGAKQRRETEVITDPDTIAAYLSEELENSDDEYYFMTTKPANNMALDSLMNRAFGKPKESMDLTSGGERIQQPVILSEIKPRGDDEK